MTLCVEIGIHSFLISAPDVGRWVANFTSRQIYPWGEIAVGFEADGLQSPSGRGNKKKRYVEHTNTSCEQSAGLLNVKAGGASATVL